MRGCRAPASAVAEGQAVAASIGDIATRRDVDAGVEESAVLLTSLTVVGRRIQTDMIDTVINIAVCRLEIARAGLRAPALIVLEGQALTAAVG